jgi:hypothetical protein
MNYINYKHFANMKGTINGNGLPRGRQVKKKGGLGTAAPAFRRDVLPHKITCQILSGTFDFNKEKHPITNFVLFMESFPQRSRVYARRLRDP